jgi:hypothetical protein
LLKNPVFSAMVAGPGRRRWLDNVELGVAADFPRRPVRRRPQGIAAAQFEARQARTSRIRCGRPGRRGARSVLTDLQGARQMLEMRRTVLAAEAAAAETAQRMRAAGNISQLDADREQAMLEASRPS